MLSLFSILIGVVFLFGLYPLARVHASPHPNRSGAAGTAALSAKHPPPNQGLSRIARMVLSSVSAE
jgi:hypothetical protein